MARKKRRFNAGAEVRKLARERIGAVKSSRAIQPKSEAKKAKHKKPVAEEWEA